MASKTSTKSPMATELELRKVEALERLAAAAETIAAELVTPKRAESSQLQVDAVDKVTQAQELTEAIRDLGQKIVANQRALETTDSRRREEVQRRIEQVRAERESHGWMGRR